MEKFFRGITIPIWWFEMVKCLACGRDNPPRALFCRTCGRNLEEQQKLHEKIKDRQIQESQKAQMSQTQELESILGGDAPAKHGKKRALLPIITLCVIAVIFLIINFSQPVQNNTIGGRLYYDIVMDDGSDHTGPPGPGKIVAYGYLENNGAGPQKAKVHLIIETGFGKRDFYEVTDTIPVGEDLQVHWEYLFDNLDCSEVECSYETLY
jgi:ribosomal protein L40E